MLIGLAGQIESGKTTLANYMCDTLEFNITSYATPLKKSCVELTGLSMEYFTDPELKTIVIPWIGKSPRMIMQLFGTEFVREMIDHDFWTNRMRQKLTTGNTSLNITNGYHVVIDDVRFSNEAELIRELGGKIIQLSRGCSDSEHPSEIIDFPVDYNIDNTHSLSVLYGQLETFMRIFNVH